jgi:hypothetical protein
VRRIQEVIIDPAVSLDGALAGQGGAALRGEAQLIASNAAEELDGAATPAMLESAQLGEGDGGGASQINGTPMTPGTTTMLAREYVWGPGDWGVDELLVQYDAARRATWPILDSGGDVIALCDLGNPNNSARVLTRIVYDAYGRVIGRSDPATPATGPPELRVGHKGLFFDRLDWGIVDPLTLEETPRLEPGATLLGYNRNRTLHVGWGRFLQRDPNATGLVVQSDLGYHGDALGGSVQGFDLAAHYGDGANVYEYVGSDPLGGSDPMGLMEFSMAGQLATMAINSWESASGTLESARMGVQTGFSLASLIQSYSVFQDVDAEWATDWSLSDEGSSHSQSFMLGIGPWDDGAAAEADQNDRFAVALRLGPNQNREVYTQRRSQWDSVRRAMWRAEAAKPNPNMNWKAGDIQRMKDGLAPKGWVMHHVKPLASGGTNNSTNLIIMRAAYHKAKYSELHKPPYSIPGRQSSPGHGRPSVRPGRR